jgi:hypothetical protein
MLRVRKQGMSDDAHRIYRRCTSSAMMRRNAEVRGSRPLRWRRCVPGALLLAVEAGTLWSAFVKLQ